MSEKEEAFFESLRATFRIEAEEHIKAISKGLLSLEEKEKALLPASSGVGVSQAEKEIEAKHLVETIFREAHSLKGAARSVNEQTIQSVCQSFENVLAAWRAGKLQVSSFLFDTLHAALNMIQQALTTPKGAVGATVAMIKRLENLVKIQVTDTPKDASFTSPLETLPEDPLGEENKAEESLREVDKAEESLGEVDKTEKTIRISLSKLDKLFQEVEELLMVKLNTQQQLVDIKKLLSDVRLREKEMKRQLYSGGCEKLAVEGAKGFKESLNAMVKTCAQNVHFVNAMVDTLLDDMKKILMQPISTMFEAMPLMVREIARNLGKEVQVVFQGGEIEIDRRILEEIKDPLIHLIRNAIDHGIEQPAEREKRNKAALSTLRITVAQSGGNNVEISVADDGGGIDSEKLKKAAVKNKLLSEKEASNMSRDEAIKLMFYTGLSTSPLITELSGRGLGLGIVSEKVDKLGGHVLVDSTLDKGTTFKLILPLTLATFRGIHITVSEEDFIMPTHNVKRVLMVQAAQIKTIENRETIVVDGQCLSYMHLADLLGIDSKESKEKNGETKRKKEKNSFFVLIVKVSEQLMAFGADQVHEEHEVLVKSLGKQGLRVKNIMAATIMEWGKVISILNPSDLIKSAINSTIGKTRKSGLQENSGVKKIILLAEDSITTRLLLQNILESSGYEVKVAVDGIEALEVLRSQPVDLLLTDVEMPRLDGFLLTGKVKEMESLKDLPIIICTSRGSREDRERGVALGANAYLDKSCFTQGILLETIKKLL